LLGGTSLASAKTGGAAGAHSKPSRPSINEVTPRPTVADPYYRLSDSYYGVPWLIRLLRRAALQPR
jgi:hypothetical protein